MVLFGLQIRVTALPAVALLVSGCFNPPAAKPVDTDGGTASEASGRDASEGETMAGTAMAGSDDETMTGSTGIVTTPAASMTATNGASTSDTESTATEETTSVESCEVGMEESCWEAEDGTSLPPLSGDPQGECRLGMRACSPEGVWGPCGGAIGPAPSDSCDVAGADNDCDGVPNEGCACTGTESRACGTDTGNCQMGMQTCENDMWGPCEGGIAAQPLDSCEVEGDDANCNDSRNEGCPCIGTQAQSCSECATQTCDPANRTWGECIVQSSSCTIDGVCYGHNAVNPDNPCQYCDAVLNQSGWTSSSNTTACDDGLFCNGNDTCNGAGECVHQFPGDSRCDGVSGPCARATCSEQARSCTLPNTEVCGQRTEYRCQPNVSCGARRERRQVRRFCSGSSATCDGAEVADTSWASDGNCGAGEACTANATSTSCSAEVGCVAWCDATDLCWLHEVPSRMNLDNANTHCNAGSWGGETDWRLPTVDEWISVLRGCNNGTISGQVASSCEMTPFRCVDDSNSCDAVDDCTSCTQNQGPDSGDTNCYWVSSLQGPCNDVYGYWTSTSYMGYSDRWVAHPRTGHIFGFGVIGNALNAKCVFQR